MKQNRYFIILLLLLFQSCEYEYSWVNNVFYDYKFNPVLENGNYKVYGKIRGSSINEIDFTKFEIVDIVTSNSRIEVSGMFTKGDTVRIDNIATKEEKLDLNYIKVFTQDTNDRIYFENDSAFLGFMQSVFTKVAKKGYVNVSVNGYINTQNAKIYIAIGNDIDIYVRQ